MSAAVLSPLVRKEARALLPFWLSAAALLTIGAGAGGGLLLASLAAYPIAAATLGAMSIGHEYAHRTLAQLLALPGARRRLLAIKAGVLLVAMVTLAGVAAFAAARFLATDHSHGLLDVFRMPFLLTLLLLPPVVGLTLAPWLTMRCRNPIAGVVFALAVPAAAWVASESLTASRNRLEGTSDLGVSFAAMWTATLAMAVAGAVLGRRAFLRLEALDEQGFTAPAVFTGGRLVRPAIGVDRSTRPSRRPVLALVSKELHIQWITFVIAGLFVAAWTVTSLLGRGSDRVGAVFGALAAIYTLLVPAIAGSLGSAEERAFGTLNWQLLQPYGRRRQWAIKAGVVVLLTVVLALILPALLESVLPVIGETPLGAFRTRPRSPFVLLVSRDAFQMLATVAIAMCALYASSLCAAALRALLLTFPLAALSLLLAASTSAAIAAFLWDAFDLNGIARAVASGQRTAAWTTATANWWGYPYAYGPMLVRIAGVLGFSALLTRFAYRNHRGADHSREAIVRQLAVSALYIVIASSAAGAVGPLMLWLTAR